MAVAAPSFAGFSPDAIQFLVELADHNDRAWFQPRKGDYERLLKEPLESLCLALDERFRTRKIPLEADPKRSPFRIYRDTRFSKDKSPYKTHLAASFPWVDASGASGSGPHGGDDDIAHGNGGYFHFQPGEMYVGGGMWHPTAERLTQFRRAIVDEPDRVTAAIDDKKFVKWFGGVESHEMLKRVPPGYPADHPMADLLRQKDIVFGRRLADKEVLSSGLPDVLADGFEAAMPVFRFLATLR